jgi:large subunit ribosomal protein L15
VNDVTRKKARKFRGSMTHGRGKQAGRGAGLRGGRGNAGLLKHRFMYMKKYMPEHYIGKHGFKRPQQSITKDTCINVGKLEEQFPNKKTINLEKEGYDKLLGGGSVSKDYKITVKKASAKAVEKIKEQNGEIKIIKQEEK